MAVNTNLLILQLLNGVALGILYLLIASGLSVIFGMTDIINIAHAVLYTLGAYFALTVLDVTGSFWIALVLAPLAVGVVGAVMERSTLHRIYDRDPLYHVILTFGFVLIGTELIELIWGKAPQRFSIPELLAGALPLGPVFYPKYKLFLIGIGVVMAIGVWALFEFTEFGLVIRAGAQDADAVRLMGLDVSNYFTGVFALAAVLAGVAGVLAGPFLNVIPSMGESVLIIAFIVVIVGGMGSFKGSVVAALLIGVVQTLGTVFAEQLTGFTVFFLMILVLLVRPQGLFGEYNIRQEATKVEFGETIPPVPLTDRRALGLIAVLAVLPLGIGTLYSSFFLAILTLVFAWALLALSLDLVVGYVGLLSFGHAAFWGLGAYATALVAIHLTNSFLLALAVSIVVTAVVAWVIGALSIRLAGIYFLIITLAFAEIFQEASVTFNDLTGGSDGLSGMPTMELLGAINLGNTVIFYYVALAIVLAVYGLTMRLLDSPFGRAMVAIRESERRLSFLGYDTEKYKRRAFTISGAIGGIAGAVFATYQTFVSPESLSWIISGDAFVIILLGGMGTLFGPMLGAAVYVGISEMLSSYIAQWRLVLGLLLVFTVMFAPRGLITLRMVAADYLDRLRAGPGPAETDGGEPVDDEPRPDGGERR
ncbi:MAG: ABC transporter permease [Halobacteriales archaeon]|nr:ABC transporter permease [Halobacteriales archaeon]